MLQKNTQTAWLQYYPSAILRRCVGGRLTYNHTKKGISTTPQMLKIHFLTKKMYVDLVEWNNFLTFAFRHRLKQKWRTYFYQR